MTTPSPFRRVTPRDLRAVESGDSVGGAARGNAAETSDLLRALLSINGRIAFPEAVLRPLVSPTAAPGYWQAYRLCDGRTSLTDIAKEVGVDIGNLSRAVTKWVEQGVAFRIGPKRCPLHLYPLPADEVNGRSAAKSTRATTAPRTRTARDSGAAAGAMPALAARVDAVSSSANGAAAGVTRDDPGSER